MFSQICKDLLHDPLTFLDVRQFSTLEHDRHLHFVLVLQKADRLSDFRVHIMLTGLGPQSNLFSLRLMRLLPGLFILLVLELAKVHDPANRRTLIGRDLDEIQLGIPSPAHRFIERDDSVLGAIGTDDSQR
jgi:hypothetical protein